MTRCSLPYDTLVHTALVAHLGTRCTDGGQPGNRDTYLFRAVKAPDQFFLVYGSHLTDYPPQSKGPVCRSHKPSFPWLARATPKLDSVPGPTTLSLPKSQHPNGVCYQSTQAGYGPTVDPHGNAVKYGSDEDISYGRDPKKHVPGTAVWAQPTITLSNGTKCCDSLTQVSAI
ncbi:uncharacterized protein PGTG_16028 [Puccinia graminis f. sp. tritici CRL 75-36-700-3]|uniref:Uncharacterized protein n=1 Tax=Puccinia graminis f. sp. tritici (strain CRL 75-36-700-3 / race SCCL) TaxID=418459 RepID=E3L1L6_PUCGT|nr:uncharacterized protein PGTG_16028 [Puccinia graminis f. sp. tritici CRL 75-36-700-3]EFP90441.2 hypothetical protein PGTG_16028 [Puccinia graminis f. sp. tritici CRL 75-36-700-3]